MPGLLLQALIHVAAPGHTLFSVVALCLIGGYCLSAAFPASQSRDAALAAALVINLMMFLNYFSLPSAGAPGSPRTLWASARDAAAFGAFETSVNSVRYVDDIARVTLQELIEFTPEDRPVLIVTTNVHRVEWFLNWRIARYYMPRHDIWVVSDRERLREQSTSGGIASLKTLRESRCACRFPGWAESYGCWSPEVRSTRSWLACRGLSQAVVFCTWMLPRPPRLSECSITSLFPSKWLHREVYHNGIQ